MNTKRLTTNFFRNVALLLLLPSRGLAAEGQWTTKADMPSTRTGLSASVLDGRIYAIGGAFFTGLPGGSTLLDTVEEYDPATDTWKERGSLLTPRSGLFTSAVNGRIYAIGGFRSDGTRLATVEEYDPTTDTWTKKADMPAPRAGGSACVVQGKIYVIGGYGPGGITTITARVEQYDPATDTWTRKADLPTSREAPTSTVGGKIYVIGGS